MQTSKTQQILKILWGMCSSLDLFTMPASSRFTFKGKRAYSIWIGKFMTFGIIFCSLAAFIYFGLNMMKRVSPKTIMAEKYNNRPPYFNLTINNFFLSFGMRNSETGQITSDESMFVPEMTAQFYNKTTNENSTRNVTLGHCESSDIPQIADLQDYFQTNPIDNMWCIKNYQPLELQGSLDSDVYEFISIKVSDCDQGGNVSCKSDEEITTFFNNNEFYLQYTTFAVDPTDYESPLKLHGNYYAIPTNNLSKSLVYLTFQHLYLTTDDGVVLKENHETHGISKIHDKAYFSPRTHDQPFIEMRINLDKISQNYERTYDKLQEVLANTGGSIKMLMIIAAIFTQPFVIFYFYRDLSNEYFDFEIPDKDNKIGKSKMEISFFDYIYCIFKKNDTVLNAKKDSWNKARSVLDINLSLSQILMKIAELEKLKFLLLEKNQLILFEYIPKPIISERHEFNRSESLERPSLATGIWKFNETFFKKYIVEDFKKAFTELKEKKAKNRVDNAILRLIFQEKNERCKKNKNNEKEGEDYTKILAQIEESDEKLPSPNNFLYIDSEIIAKDLQSLKK